MKICSNYNVCRSRISDQSCGHGINQYTISIHVRIIRFEFVENFIPENHTMTLGI